MVKKIKRDGSISQSTIRCIKGGMWIVGKYFETESNTIIQAWEFFGVFDNKQKAIEQCEDENYFIAPAELNQVLSKKSIIWPGCYYPLCE